MHRTLLSNLTAYAATVLGVGLTTALIHAIPGANRISNISLLYLLVVIAAAYCYGHGPAVLASLLGVLAFDWFFIEPRHTWWANDPAEWLALAVFLVTAIVISQLTATLRLRVEEARQRERETNVLAEVSWAIASQVSYQQTLIEVLRRMVEVSRSEAGAIVLRDAERGLQTIARFHSGDAPDKPPGEQWPNLSELPYREALEQALNERYALIKTTAGLYLPVVLEQRILGAIYLQRAGEASLTPTERRVVESLTNHAAVAIERHHLTQAETQAQAIREADKLKTALLSMVSHDFRSPLASIKASVTGLLQEGALWDSEMQHELLQGINQETDRLNRMVGNILALSRLEADAWQPQCEIVSLAEVVGAVLDTFNAQDNARINVALDSAPKEVWLDSVQIVQVLHNLLENALKYSPAGSPVELNTSQDGDDLTIEVADRGVGLPVGEEYRVFEHFYRAPRWRESSSPGTGIGLAVCLGLVEAHGGHLTAKHRSGGGSVFQLKLPPGPQELSNPARQAYP